MRWFPCFPVLTPAIIGNARHWAGAIQRDRGDQILKPVRAHLAQHIAHALAFHLENAAGLAPCQHVISFLVVERQFIEVQMDFLIAQKAHRALQDRQGSQTEEVELHQPRLFHMLHGILRDEIFRTRIAVQRHQFH